MKKQLFLSLCLLSALSLFSQEKASEIGAHTPINQADIDHQIAVEKYANFLEQTDFYAFHDHDLDRNLTEFFHEKNKTRLIPLKPSLYSHFNALPLGIQDEITGYLQATIRSDVLNPATNSFPMINDPVKRAAFITKFQDILKKSQ